MIKRRTVKHQRGITPGQFITMLKADLFAYSKIEQIEAGIELNILPTGFLNPKTSQKAVLNLLLVRTPAASK